MRMDMSKCNRKLNKQFGGRVRASFENDCIVLRGELERWPDVISACRTAARKYSRIHVVNDIVCPEAQDAPMRRPSFTDHTLEGAAPDVLVIGGGISGASIARELTKWKLNVLLVEKESDLALQASGRNDGEVHPGIDLGKGSLKHKYIRTANRMFDTVCKDLNVEFHRVGQYVLFGDVWLKPLIRLYCLWRKYHDGIEDTVLISGAQLKRKEPLLDPEAKFAILNPSAGVVCPYGLTIAYAENAVQNGAKVSLGTAVLGMEVENGTIRAVHTNRGTLYPKVVINAAGVFAEEIAKMADDRFYSIHPRRGTNSILDKKTGVYMHSIASVIDLRAQLRAHTKGGGTMRTAHGNLLAGPDAVETWQKENTETHPESIRVVFDKQKKTLPRLSERDIITYFTGVRAPTFEEDFIIERGRRTKNLIHCAGIQSPGLTTAPAVAIDVAQTAADMLSEKMTVEKNPAFDPVRKGIPALREMDEAQRAELIKENPDYGVIVCRCEEVSKGEILDALRSPICVPTLDGVKKRVRPGMGRCQGGFCSPLVTQIIADYLGVPLSEVRKSGEGSVITFGKTKTPEGGGEA